MVGSSLQAACAEIGVQKSNAQQKYQEATAVKIVMAEPESKEQGAAVEQKKALEEKQKSNLQVLEEVLDLFGNGRLFPKVLVPLIHEYARDPWFCMQVLYHRLDLYQQRSAGNYSLAVSDQGVIVAGEARDGLLQVWNADGTKQGDLFHGGKCLQVTIGVDRSIVSVSLDDTVKIWQDGEASKHFDKRTVSDLRGTDRQYRDYISNMMMSYRVVSSTGMIVSAHNVDEAGIKKGVIKIWENGVLKKKFGNTDSWCSALAIRGDGAIVVGHEDGSVSIWKDGVLLDTLRGHADRIECIAVTKNNCIATLDGEGVVKVWNDNSCQYTFVEQKIDGLSLRRIAIHPDGVVVTSHCGSNDLKFWTNGYCCMVLRMPDAYGRLCGDILSWEERLRSRSMSGSSVSAIAVGAEGTVVAVSRNVEVFKPHAPSMKAFHELSFQQCAQIQTVIRCIEKLNTNQAEQRIILPPEELALFKALPAWVQDRLHAFYNREYNRSNYSAAHFQVLVMDPEEPYTRWTYDTYYRQMVEKRFR